MTWTDEAACAGDTALMFDRYRQPAARAVCASCPVAGICLWSAMADEADEPHEYRYGVSGGVIPHHRAQLGAGLSRAEIADRLADALAVHAGAASRYRPLRACRGCTSPISQPRAGRPRAWCSSACRQRATVDRAADAERKRGLWESLGEEERRRRRQAFAARWAALSPARRAAAAAKRRQRRQRRAERAAA